MDGKTRTYSQAYDALAYDVSISTSATNIEYQGSFTIKESARAHFDEISAVSTQEETVNLARYQQAYQASAQILQTAKTIFDIIVSLGRS